MPLNLGLEPQAVTVDRDWMTFEASSIFNLCDSKRSAGGVFRVFAALMSIHVAEGECAVLHQLPGTVVA